MGATPIHALPYPTPSDPVNQGALNFNQLATALDGKLPPKGGASGLFLAKSSSSDYAYAWVPLGGGLVPAGGAAGQVLTKTSSTDYASSWQTPTGGGGGGTQGAELDYKEFTANVSCPNTTEAASTSIVTSSSVVYDGATKVLLTFFAPAYQSTATGASGGTFLVLWDNTAGVSLGLLAADKPSATNADQFVPVCARILTPAAGARVYSVRGYGQSASMLTIMADVGGVGKRVPGFLRITKV